MYIKDTRLEMNAFRLQSSLPKNAYNLKKYIRKKKTILYLSKHLLYISQDAVILPIRFCAKSMKCFCKKQWKRKKCNIRRNSSIIPPKPGRMLKSWSSILRSCSDFINGDLVISGLRLSIGLYGRETTNTMQQIIS